MEHKKLKSIKCECGNPISVRALTRHLIGKRYFHTDKFTHKTTELIKLNKIHRCAWRISEGTDALRDDYWCAKVLNGEVSINELTFISPRKLGENTPKALKKISIDRMGKGNPSLINKPKYDIEKIKEFGAALFAELKDDPKKFNKLDKALDVEFPEYRYSFVGMFPSHKGPRGHNRRNATLSYIIDRPIEWIVSEKAQDRGKFISKGQLKSPNLIKMVNAGRKALRGHVTIPHNTLFNMVLSLDKNAKKEKQIDCDRTWKSYDIFSPSKNLLIEMHGRVWHDLEACKPKMMPLVTENVENDKIKEKLAKDKGYDFIVFWDDEQDTWESKLEDIYGKRSKSYEKALREEINKKRKC